MYSSIANLPQPHVPLGFEITPTSPAYFEVNGTCNPALAFGAPGACKFNNAATLISYFDAVNRAGMSYADLNMALSPIVASAEYAAYCSPATMTCLAPRSFEIAGLANLDALVAHVLAAGKTYHLAPNPDAMVIAAAYGCDVTAGTEANIQKCLLPLLVATAQHFRSAARITIFHEPTGALPLYLGETLSVADFATLVTAVSAAMHTAVPGMPLGVGAIVGEGTYVTAWRGIAGISYGGLDIYSFNCNPAAYTATTLPAFLTLQNTMTAAGLLTYVNESARPRWCPLGGSFTESAAYMGCGDELWGSVQTSTLTAAGLTATGADDAWQAVFIAWARAHGFKGVSIFSSQPMIAYAPADPTGATDNCQTGSYMTSLMGNLGGNTETAAAHARINGGTSSPTGLSATVTQVR